MSFKKIVQRVVNIKAKVDLRSSAIVWDSDVYYSKTYHSSHNTVSKMQTQGITAKESNFKKFKPQKSKLINEKSSAPPCTNDFTKPKCHD